jgi:hypothetical protein
VEASKVDGATSKAPTLVLQLTAIIGTKASPKVLIQFMKALTTYFDQTPGTFAISRIYIKYVMTEISSGRPAVEIPMERFAIFRNIIEVSQDSISDFHAGP